VVPSSFGIYAWEKNTKTKANVSLNNFEQNKFYQFEDGFRFQQTQKKPPPKQPPPPPSKPTTPFSTFLLLHHRHHPNSPTSLFLRHQQYK
jgi:hypothetical protein